MICVMFYPAFGFFALEANVLRLDTLKAKRWQKTSWEFNTREVEKERVKSSKNEKERDMISN